MLRRVLFSGVAALAMIAGPAMAAEWSKPEGDRYDGLQQADLQWHVSHCMDPMRALQIRMRILARQHLGQERISPDDWQYLVRNVPEAAAIDAEQKKLFGCVLWESPYSAEMKTLLAKHGGNR